MTRRPFEAALDAIVDRALEIDDAAARRAFVLRETASNPELRARVEWVLAEADRSDGFLEPDGRLAEAVLGEADEHALAAGDRFTSYEVLALVGRGGMGEVYRARDPRLGRHVALKVLPTAFVDDAHRLDRFEREARLLASLNHPNIAAIYGLAEDGGRQALVLEFVEGTTLAECIANGPLPMPDALAIARQVALALEAAHRRGIVHRDLKPANISVASDGTVKVLDFGLAKAIEGPHAAQEAGLTSAGLPAGAVLGTPAYMAPEQARGADVDERADIWAFGCVVFEMLSGVRAFGGDTASEVIARVLERDPDFTLLPARTPEPIVRMLRRCLTKDPRRRLASIADALLEIDEAGARAPSSFARGLRAWRSGWLRAAIGLTLLLVGVGGGALLRRGDDVRDTSPVHLGVPIPPGDELLVSAQQAAAISPDGRTIVYRAVRAGEVHLFRRSLDRYASDPIPGTRDAAAPFFSPDGAWLGFDGDGVLRKVSLAGGSPVTICDAPGGANASWGGDTIVFATATGRVLHRVPARGGTAEPITALDTAAGDLAHAFPHVLPDGRAALFTIVRPDNSSIAVVHLETREVRTLIRGTQPRYLPTGHLLFVRERSLWAAGFDAARHVLTSEPVPVLEGLDTAGGTAAHFAVAASGSLVYAPERLELPERRVVWVDRRGVEVPIDLEPRRYTRATLSPDGSRLAIALTEGGNTDIWTASVRDGSVFRLTRAPTVETAPLWSPDGRWIVFRSEQQGGGLYRRAADGTGDAERLTSSDGTMHTPHGWAPDGRLLFTEFHSYSRQAILSVDPNAPAGVTRILDGAYAQLRPHVSPDGRWLAYQSDESGRFEVYVRTFPNVDGGRWQVSRNGGTSPRWSADGRTLFFYDGRGLLASSIAGGTVFSSGTPARLFDYSPFSGRLGPDYEVSRDGQRFLMIRSAADTPSTRAQLVLVQNWLTALSAKLGT
jgi:serine/threonine-protein kinase